MICPICSSQVNRKSADGLIFFGCESSTFESGGFMQSEKCKVKKLNMLLGQAIAMLRQAEPQLPHEDFGIAADIRIWLALHFAGANAERREEMENQT